MKTLAELRKQVDKLMSAPYALGKRERSRLSKLIAEERRLSKLVDSHGKPIEPWVQELIKRTTERPS